MEMALVGEVAQRGSRWMDREPLMESMSCDPIVVEEQLGVEVLLADEVDDHQDDGENHALNGRVTPARWH